MQGYTTPQICQAIGFAILGNADGKVVAEASAGGDAGGKGPAYSPMRHLMVAKADGSIGEESIKALVRNKVDDLHVLRLRQITNRIEINLNYEAATRKAKTTKAGPDSTPFPAKQARRHHSASVVAVPMSRKAAA
jgi:hypothetical protein